MLYFLGGFAQLGMTFLELPHSETTGVQYFNLVKSHVNKQVLFGVDPIYLYVHTIDVQIYQFVNIPIETRLMFELV